ncbi:MAG: type II secretion system protein GspM [Methylococcales bacterium]|nr:type II secretion system protein GspM [Methylococcales bacterium]MDP3838371.1 type II secretion system protein GspM [Methylococcales bacterium]
MSNDTLTAQQQRWLAVGLLIVVMLIAGLLIIMPAVSKGLELNETKNNLLFKLQQYERILAKKEVVLANRDKIKQQSMEQGYFNGQETEAVASAEMQDLIKQIIVGAGGQLTSTQTIPADNNAPDDTAKFNHIVVRVSMTGNSEMLRTVLYKIETAVPLMIIDQIDIRPMRGRRNRKTGLVDPTNELTINFQAVSFMRKPPNE